MRPALPLAALVLVLPAAAQETAAPGAPAATLPAAIPDFGEGLRRLAELGLPPMQGAVWTRTPKGLKTSLDGAYQVRSLGGKSFGGFWTLPGEPPRRIGFGTPKEIEPPAAGDATAEEQPETADEGQGLLGKMLRRHNEEKAAQPPPKPVEPPKPAALLEEDVKRLVDALQKPETASQLENRIQYGGGEIVARTLLFAAQLHAAGRPELANQVAAALFRAIPDHVALVDLAVNQLAATAYLDLVSRFFEDHDWQRYHQEATALLTRYPRGWSEGPGVAMLLPALAKRASGAMPPPPSLEGVALKPAALVLLAELLEPVPEPRKSDEELAAEYEVDLDDYSGVELERMVAALRARAQGPAYSSAGLWLLPENPDGDEKDPLSSPVARLQAMGMDGLLALAAVATDDTLTFLPHAGEKDDSSSFSRDQSSADRAQVAYDSMTRPASRGEIAVALLSQTLPLGDEEATDGPSLQRAAIAFWRENHDKPPVELAKVFIATGNEFWKSRAMEFLATSDDPQAAPAFEAVVLDAEEPLQFNSEVEQYLERKKAAARPFFEAFSKMLKESYDGLNNSQMGYSSGAYAIQRAGGLDTYLKTLAVKVGSASLRDLVTAALAAPAKEDDPENPEEELQGRSDPFRAEEDRSAIGMLAKPMNSATIDECLRVVAEVADKASPEQLRALYEVLLSRILRDDPRTGPSLPPADGLRVTQETLALWRPLVARTEPLDETKSTSSWPFNFGAGTLGDNAATLLEFAATPTSAMQLTAYEDLAGEASVVTAFIRERVTRRLAGEEPPPWPAASAVIEARRAEISSRFSALPADEIVDFVEALPLQERAVVKDLIRTYDEDHPAPEGLLQLRSRVTRLGSVAANPQQDDRLAAELGIGPGFQLTARTLTQLGERLAREGKERSRTSITLSEAPLKLGWRAEVLREPLDPQPAFSADPPVITILRNVLRNRLEPEANSLIATPNGYSLWALKDGQVTPVETPQSALAEFEEWLASKSFDYPVIRLGVLSREDAEKITDQ